MSPTIVWGIIFFILVATELLTGTIYLLLIALGALVGWLAAYFGFDLHWQLALAGIISASTTALWHLYRYKNPRSANYTKNRDALIDIGEFVDVVHWDPEQTTRVRYRGAEWSARWVGEGAPTTGRCVIRSIKGTQLQLDAPKKDE